MSTTYGPGRFESIVDRSITEIKSNVKTVGQYAFYGCTKLTSAEFPNATSIGQYAFYGCSKLESAEFPNTTSIGEYAFYGCTALENMDFLNVTTISGWSFMNCKAIKSVHFPRAKLVGYGFSSCTSLQNAVIGNLNGESGSFDGCSNLTTVDIVISGRTGVNAFNNCSALISIIIRPNAVQELRNISAFTGTPFASGGTGGTIYIPKALYDHLGDGTSSDYKAAANWSTIDGYGTITWAQIEGSQYENYYADRTLIE